MAFVPPKTLRNIRLTLKEVWSEEDKEYMAKYNRTYNRNEEHTDFFDSVMYALIFSSLF